MVTKTVAGESVLIPQQLLNGGSHFDDDPHRQRRGGLVSESAELLPREELYAMVLEGDYRRPARVN